LTAAGINGWTFSGWSGDADCQDGTVTMVSARYCAATFNPPVIPAPVVDLANTTINTTSFRTGDGEKVVLGFLLTSDSTDAEIHELIISANGDLNATAEIGSVYLYRDDNKNGIPEAIERVVAGSNGADNGEVTFTLPQAYQFPVGETRFLVTYNF